MGFHVVLEADTQSGKRVDPDKVDRAAGSLLSYRPTFSGFETEPRLTITVHIEESCPSRALQTARERVSLAFAFVNEPLVLRSATIYTEDEFNRILSGG